MAMNAIPTHELKIVTELAAQRGGSCPPVALRQRLAKLLREVFAGHEEYLGMTPD